MQGNIIDAELNMNIVKMVFLFILTYYIDFKIMNKKIRFDMKHNIAIIIMGVASGIVKYTVSPLMSIIMLIIMVSIIFSKNNMCNSILATIISLGINYGIGAVSVMLCFWIEKISGIKNNIFELFIILISYVVLLFIFFKIKRFKYGISFLQKNISNEYMDLIVLNISVILLFLGIELFNYNNMMAGRISFEIIIYSIIMYITIEKSLNLYYKQKLLVQELKETKEELIKSKTEIQELEAENLSFKKKSHSLTHQQKALEYKMQQILMQTEISQEQSAEVKSKLEKIKKEIYKEQENIENDKTGIEEIDDMLKYMRSECNKNKIEFILKIKCNIHQMINNAISKEDLEILLADHIKNAIIAINHTNNINKTIMVKLGKENSIYKLEIYDSGIEFEQETLKKLGKIPSTTHADEGGTGMGFMNTFETLRKYKASLIIEEYGKPNKDNYTKLLSIKFDKKNEFKIQSYRR